MSRPLRALPDTNAVPDTNVLIAAAINPTGLCRELLEAAIEHEWEPVVSPLLLSELEELLRRPKFSTTITDEAIREFVNGVAVISEVATNPPPATSRSRDRKGDYLLELAPTVRVVPCGSRRLSIERSKLVT